MNEQISFLVDLWTVAWTVVLLLGYLAEFTPFPRLSLLRHARVAHAMMLSSAAVVLGLTLGERTEAAAIVTAIERVLTRAGLTAAQYDTTDVSGNLRGCRVDGPTPSVRQLAPMLLAYDIINQEDNGRLRFLDFNAAETVALDSDDLAAHQFGTRLVVVLGHSQCGAVVATVDELAGRAGQPSPNLRSIVDRIRPSVESLRSADPPGLQRALRWSFAVHLSAIVLLLVLPESWISGESVDTIERKLKDLFD